MTLRIRRGWCGAAPGNDGVVESVHYCFVSHVRRDITMICYVSGVSVGVSARRPGRFRRGKGCVYAFNHDFH